MDHRSRRLLADGARIATDPADDWREHAACRDEDPELFFPTGTTGPALAQVEQAKAVCRRCPVTAQCLQWALKHGEDAGVWGGLSEDERRAVKREMQRRGAAPRPAPVVRVQRPIRRHYHHQLATDLVHARLVELGLTQRGVMRLAGIGRTRLYDWTRGGGCPGPDSPDIRELARVLGLAPDVIVTPIPRRADPDGGGS